MTLRIFLIAGEASGDQLGASLMRALKEIHPQVIFAGIGGAEMQAQGLQSLFPMHELSVMGVWEVFPSLWRILKRMRQTLKAIVAFSPQALITIDAPDFCFRIAKKAKSKNQRLFCAHYVAPSVWAWRPGRAKKIAGFLNHLFALLPFEPAYFEQHGLKTTFVGHPIVERSGQCGDARRFRQKHGLKSGQPVLCLLPGSRTTELKRLLPIFCETADIVLRRRPEVAIVIPTLPHLQSIVESYFIGKGINPILILNDEEKFDCFSASTVALAASGTVTLELALCDTPHAITYKLSPLSSWLAKKIIRTPYVNLINLLLERPIVPELLLEDCAPHPLSQSIFQLMENKETRILQLAGFREALLKLGLGDTETPGQKAAVALIAEIKNQSG